MKIRSLVLLMTLSISVQHLEGKTHRNHTGQLLRMETVTCGPDEGGISKTIFGPPAGGAAAEEKLCPEYILESEGLYYRIRPKDHKHPVLLPIGEEAQFHFQKDRLVLQIEDFDSASFEFTVLAIVPEDHMGNVRARAHVVVGTVQ